MMEWKLLVQKELSNKQIKLILRELSDKPSLQDYLRDQGLFYIEEQQIKFFVGRKDGKALLFLHQKKILPTLHILHKNLLEIPSIFVDKGAIPHIVNGADLFAPGISRKNAFKENELVVIRDARTELPLALGISLMSSNEVKNTGKVVKNLHWTGDALWRFSSK